ncbi:MAG TPA: hypothetical protein VK745_26745 [Polyangiaceae bacterium]|jgi:hypothetical protein|nr:hypothetical protein [Polyangiaceae bacterium]
MRSVAARHPDHVSNRTLGLLSVALCLALVALVIAVIIVRNRAGNSDVYAPIAHETQDERELRMGWSELGAVAAADPPPPPAAPPTPNASLPESVVSTMPAQSPLMSTLSPAPNVPTASASAPVAAAPGVTAAAVASAAPNGAAPSAPPNVTVVQVANDEDDEEPCGRSFCRGGLVCCNASCGTCVEPGQKCSQFVCGMSLSLESVACGQNTCNTGDVCCNASCGTCTKPGETCDTRPCDNAIQYPTSQACGMTTCNVGTVCCNPSCGICAAPGEPCSQSAC